MIGYLRKISGPMVLPLAIFLSLGLSLGAAGCGKKEENPSPSRAVISRTPMPRKESPARPLRPLSFHSVLTKDLNRLVPASAFSRNDRIYLHTSWTGLQGSHEIKVLWVRPDGKVQETVRIKRDIPSDNLTFTSWAYLSFKKTLLNITPFEALFIGNWKAQLFLDGKLLQEYPFSVS